MHACPLIIIASGCERNAAHLFTVNACTDWFTIFHCHSENNRRDKEIAKYRVNKPRSLCVRPHVACSYVQRASWKSLFTILTSLIRWTNINFSLMNHICKAYASSTNACRQSQEYSRCSCFVVSNLTSGLGNATS